MDPLMEKAERADAPGPRTGIRRPSLTLGIEEEFQLIDPETRELKSHIQELVLEGEARLGEQFKVEMHQSVIEVGSNICANIQEARAEVIRLRGEIIRLTRDRGLCIASGGTHPITHWKNVQITPGARYEQIVKDLQTIARANLIFGLHVHVAVEDNDTRQSVTVAAGQSVTAEDRNLLDVSRAMATSALFREESRGAHYRADFPYTDDEHFRGHTRIEGRQTRLHPVEAPIPASATT